MRRTRRGPVLANLFPLSRDFSILSKTLLQTFTHININPTISFLVFHSCTSSTLDSSNASQCETNMSRSSVTSDANRTKIFVYIYFISAVDICNYSWFVSTRPITPITESNHIRSDCCPLLLLGISGDRSGHIHPKADLSSPTLNNPTTEF